MKRRRSLLISAIILGVVALTSPLWFRALSQFWTGTRAPRTEVGIPAAIPTSEVVSAPSRELRVTVQDSESAAPVTGALVQVDSIREITGADGVAVLAGG